MRSLKVGLLALAAIAVGFANAPVANAQASKDKMMMEKSTDKKAMMTKPMTRAEKNAKEREQTKMLNEAQLKK